MKARGLGPKIPSAAPLAGAAPADEVAPRRAPAPDAASGFDGAAPRARGAAEVQAPVVPLGPVIDRVWARRHDLATQPHPGSAWLAACGPAPLERLVMGPEVYMRGLYEVMLGRPAGARTTSTRSVTTDGLRDRIRAAIRGEGGWGKLARERLTFDRAEANLDDAKQQVFLHVPPEHVGRIVAALTQDVLDAAREHPGVLRLEVASPFVDRPGNLVLSTTGGEATEALLDRIRRLQQNLPEAFVDRTPPLTRPRGLGVATVDVPDRARYPEASFRSVRTQVLHAAAVEAAQRGSSRADFEALLSARLREAGIDPERPDRNLPGAPALADVPPVPLPGARGVDAGRHAVEVPGFDGERLAVEIEISEEVSALLGRRDNVRFLPEQGLFAKVDVDRTRNPPRERVAKQFVAAFVDDTRYRLDFGTAPPPFVHFDAATGTYHVPKKVTLAPLPRGVWGNYRLQVELDPARPGVAPPPRPRLVEQLADREVQGDKLARVMAKIDAYVSAPEAGVAARVVLEEGTNGVSVVGLDNRAHGVWKPSAAEYPEQARLHLEPDHQARREAFAYFISERLGHLGRVPPTVFRELDGEPGAFSALSRGTLPGTHSPRLDALLETPDDPDYRDLAVFDCVIGNLDRHAGNVLLDDDVMLAIDHGLAFPLEHGPQGEMNFLFGEDVPLSQAHRAALEGLVEDEGEVRAEADRLGVAAAAVDRLFERVQEMLLRGVTYADWRR